MNTFFKHPERRVYTWKSPGDVHRNQIDYIMIRHRFRNSVIQCKTYPGADIGSDHNPVIAKIKIKLKKLQKAVKKTPKVDIAKLKTEEIQRNYFIEVTNRYSVLSADSNEDLNEEEIIEHEYNCLKESIIHGNESAPKIEKKCKKLWMTEEILVLMDERKKAKMKNQKEYVKLHNTIKKKCKEAKESFLAEKCEKKAHRQADRRAASQSATILAVMVKVDEASKLYQLAGEEEGEERGQEAARLGVSEREAFLSAPATLRAMTRVGGGGRVVYPTLRSFKPSHPPHLHPWILLEEEEETEEMEVDEDVFFKVTSAVRSNHPIIKRKYRTSSRRDTVDWQQELSALAPQQAAAATETTCENPTSPDVDSMAEDESSV